MEMKQVSDNRFAVRIEKNRVCDANSGHINRAEGVVVETPSDVAPARQMIRLFSTVWSAMPKRVINTHEDGDHLRGDQLFEGAEIIAHRSVPEPMTHVANPQETQKLRIEFGPYGEWRAPARLYRNVERACREFRNAPPDAPWNTLATLEFAGGFCLTKGLANGNPLGPYLFKPDEVGIRTTSGRRLWGMGTSKYRGSTSEISRKAEDVFAWLGFMAPLKPGTVTGFGTIPDGTGLDQDHFIDPGAASGSGPSAAASPSRPASRCPAAGRSGRECKNTT